MLGGLAADKDGGAGVTFKAGGASNSLGDAAVAITGTTIDRIPAGGGDASASRFDSCSILVSYKATLTSTKTWTFSLDIEQAPPSDNDPDVAGTFANVPASHQPTPSSFVIDASGNGFIRYDMRLSDLDRYIRVNIPAPTPSLVNASEILNLQIVVALYGPRLVVTRTVDATPGYDA